MRVTLTIELELEMAALPSEEALSVAHQRAEQAAARVFVCGDLGGRMRVDVEPSDNGVEKSCEAVNVLAGRMRMTVGREKRNGKAVQP